MEAYIPAANQAAVNAHWRCADEEMEAALLPVARLDPDVARYCLKFWLWMREGKQKGKRPVAPLEINQLHVDQLETELWNIAFELSGTKSTEPFIVGKIPDELMPQEARA